MTYYAFILATTLVVQFLLVCITFPVQELFTAMPLLRVDSAFHWYQIWTAARLGSDHPLVGFDPYMSAGYLNGFTFNASARLPALFAAVFPAISDPAIIYKCFSFFSALLAPACLPFAARMLRIGPLATAFAALIGIILWWTSDLHAYHTSGLISFVFASFWGIAYAAVLIRLTTSEFSLWKNLLLGFVGAVGFLYHPLFPIIVFPIAATSLYFQRRTIVWRTLWLSYAIVGLCALLPNLPWILVTLKYPSVANNALMHYFKETGAVLIIQQLLGLEYSGSRFHLALTVGAGWGCIFARNELQRQIARAFAAAAALMCFFAAFGAMLPSIATLQPNRFFMTAFVVLGLPAAIGVAQIWEDFRWPLKLRVNVLVTALLLVVTGYSLNEVRRELSSSPIGHHGAVPPEVRGEGEKTRWLVEWIRNNTDPDSRILFEHSSHGVYDTVHIPGYLAAQTNREFIGGAYPMRTSTSFWDGWIFDRLIDTYPPDELLNRFRMYNIGWAIVHSDKSVHYLDQIRPARLTAEFGAIKIYRIENPPGFVFDGDGKVVERDINRIVVAGLTGKDVILRYHFLPCLKADPPTQIDGVMVEPDSSPFIRLRSPSATTTISCTF